MLTFRSPLLKMLPQDRSQEVFQRASQRLFITVLVLLTLVSLSYLVRTKSLPMEGFYWLYWFHDHVFLPAKGALYTRYFPWSLAWIGVFITLAVLGWLTYVLGKSPLQIPHAFLVRWTTRNAALHPLLLGLAELFKRAGIPLTLLREAVVVERDLQLEAMFQLRDDKTQERKLQQRFLRQTDLFVGLAKVYDKDVAMREKAVRMVLESLLWAKPFAQMDSQKAEHQILNNLIAKVIRLLPLPSDANAFNQAVSWPGTLLENSIALDTLLVFSAFVPGGDERMGAALGTLQEEKVVFADLVHLRLAQASDDRAAFYDQLRDILQVSPFARVTHLDDLDLAATAGSDEAEVAARASQALLIACQAARFNQDANLLARYLETLEALKVAAEASSPSPDAAFAEVRRLALAMTRDLPTTEHYRFASQLAVTLENSAQVLRSHCTWPSGAPGVAKTQEAWPLEDGLRLAAGREADRLTVREVTP